MRGEKKGGGEKKVRKGRKMGRRAARGLVGKQESHQRYLITDFTLTSLIIQD